MWSSPLDGSIRMIHQYSIPGMSFGFLSTPIVKHTQQASNIYLYSHLPGQERHRKESRTKQQCEKKRKREYDENTQNNTRLELLKLDNK